MSAAQEYRLVIDLDQTTPQTKPKNDLYQGDKEANVVVLEMVRKGEPVTLSGYTARGSMERSDGNQVPCEGAVEDNTVRITLNEHCYVYAGPYKLDIELNGNGLRRTVAQINGVVQQTAQGPTININESIVDVDTVIALYNEMKTAKDETVQATQKANSAANNANSAANTANTATNNANAATTAANNAANKANTAASNANAATTNANNAAGAANQAAGRAETVASKSPYIGSNGNWYVYDVTAGAFVDSGSSAKGLGDVSSVDGIHPDTTGDVPFTADGAGAHNARYRGKNLGSAVTAEQYAAIADGTFRDLFIGDYWTIGGVNYRIAAFDYYYMTGDNIYPVTNTAPRTHHVTIVPDRNFYKMSMNTTLTTAGAYIGSEMYASGLEGAKNTIKSAFGESHILNHRAYFQNAVTGNYASGGSWYDSTVELMNERNVYGCRVNANLFDVSGEPNNGTTDKSQFPLFVFRPDLIGGGVWFWLRDVASSTKFCTVADTGISSMHNATSNAGVRPKFSLIG